jgi:hypothetical protein
MAWRFFAFSCSRLSKSQRARAGSLDKSFVDFTPDQFSRIFIPFR